MTPKQVALVQDSFAKVVLTSEAAAMLFYDRLFDTVPQMRAMFPDDMIEQRRKLMATLAVVVKGLGNLAGRERIGKAACQLRCEGATLSGSRRRVAVDTGEGPGGCLDAGSGGCVGHRL
jgi:truncated hemoglobin YjbI